MIATLYRIELRQKIVTFARSWLGTPFRDGARLKHVGVDCANLPAAVYFESGVLKTNPVFKPYSPQIYLHRRPDGTWDDTYLRTLLEIGAEVGMREIAERDAGPGDLALFQIAHSYTHGGIIESWPDSIIHPIRPHGVICSSTREGFVKFRKRKVFSIF